MSTAPDKTDQIASDTAQDAVRFHVRLISFGYKQGVAPHANATFDVRFLKNPYWVEELRPMTGRDLPVQEYVMNQKAASEFLDSICNLLGRLFPELAKSEFKEFSIAFGCTGGQHRSTTMVELLAQRIAQQFPNTNVDRFHRELDGKGHGHDAKGNKISIHDHSMPAMPAPDLSQDLAHGHTKAGAKNPDQEKEHRNHSEIENENAHEHQRDDNHGADRGSGS